MFISVRAHNNMTNTVFMMVRVFGFRGYNGQLDNNQYVFLLSSRNNTRDDNHARRS